MDIVKRVLAGDRRALSKLMTIVENDLFSAYPYLDELFPHTGKAHIIGVTGSPGSGKSSLVNQLVKKIRSSIPEESRPVRVGVIAVDPSSPFSGGALLGDRIRMRDLSLDPDVFIRSMASRGALGGLANTTFALAQILDAAGYAWIIIETVGTGQSEIEIARLAQTTIVVLSPMMGDDIQVNKAGILEIADILTVNKCDQPGAESITNALEIMLHTAQTKLSGHHQYPREGLLQPDMNQDDDKQDIWIPPVIPTNSITGQGFDSLMNSVNNHRDFLLDKDMWICGEKQRLEKQIQELIQSQLYSRWYAQTTHDTIKEVLANLLLRKTTPYKAVSELLGIELAMIEWTPVNQNLLQKKTH